MLLERPQLAADRLQRQAQSMFGLLVATSLMTRQSGISQAATEEGQALMGYSSIAQAGYLLIGVSMVQPVGAASVVLFLISYAVTNVAAFIAIIALVMLGRWIASRFSIFATSDPATWPTSKAPRSSAMIAWKSTWSSTSPSSLIIA